MIMHSICYGLYKLEDGRVSCCHHNWNGISLQQSAIDCMVLLVHISSSAEKAKYHLKTSTDYHLHPTQTFGVHWLSPWYRINCVMKKAVGGPDQCRILQEALDIGLLHIYNDIIMGAVASQIVGVSIVYSAVCTGTDERKYQSSASLAFVKGIHRWLVNSRHKGSVARKMFLFHDVIMICWQNGRGSIDHGYCVNVWEPNRVNRLIERSIMAGTVCHHQEANKATDDW